MFSHATVCDTPRKSSEAPDSFDGCLYEAPDSFDGCIREAPDSFYGCFGEASVPSRGVIHCTQHLLLSPPVCLCNGGNCFELTLLCRRSVEASWHAGEAAELGNNL
jgi:hypothetical protein